MKLSRVLSQISVAALLGLLVAGCSGINASPSVAPIDFLMPGLRVQHAPAAPTLLAPPPNLPPGTQLAQTQ